MDHDTLKNEKENGAINRTLLKLTNPNQ